MAVETEAEGRQRANPFGGAPAAGGLVSVEQQRAVAEVQAAIVVARSVPRNRTRVLDQILMDCTDPELAEDAEYEYARGGSKISGPSIRLMETIARRWGNFECGVREIARREGYSEMETYAWDMETNFRDRKTFQMRHWRDTKEGGYAVADERDVYEVTANMAARRKRACMEAVIPTEIIRQAQAQCQKTLAMKIQITPEVIADMLTKFAEYGVTKEMIEARIQRHLEAMTPGLGVQLRRIYNSLKDGMSSANEWFDLERKEPEERPKTGAAALAAGVRAKKAAKAETAAPTGDQLLKDVLRCAERAGSSKDEELGRLALDDARDLARTLTGEQAKQADAAIIEAEKILAKRFAKPA